jgi:trimethylguanosine synthase
VDELIELWLEREKLHTTRPSTVSLRLARLGAGRPSLEDEWNATLLDDPSERLRSVLGGDSQQAWLLAVFAGLEPVLTEPPAVDADAPDVALLSEDSSLPGLASATATPPLPLVPLTHCALDWRPCDFPPEGVSMDDSPRRPPDIPDKYWAMRRKLFSPSAWQKGVIIPDLVSFYSITPALLARHHAERARDAGCLLVLDACCGVGGNSVAFAAEAGHVLGVEIDPSRLAAAKHNAEALGVAAHCDWLLADWTTLGPAMARRGVSAADLCFLSPPWGGPAYKDSPVFDLDQPLAGEDSAAALLRVALRLAPRAMAFLPRTTARADVRRVLGEAVPSSADGVSVSAELEKNWCEGKEKGCTLYASLVEPFAASTATRVAVVAKNKKANKWGCQLCGIPGMQGAVQHRQHLMSPRHISKAIRVEGFRTPPGSGAEEVAAPVAEAVEAAAAAAEEEEEEEAVACEAVTDSAVEDAAAVPARCPPAAALTWEEQARDTALALPIPIPLSRPPPYRPPTLTHPHIAYETYTPAPFASSFEERMAEIVDARATAPALFAPPASAACSGGSSPPSESEDELSQQSLSFFDPPPPPPPPPPPRGCPSATGPPPFARPTTPLTCRAAGTAPVSPPRWRRRRCQRRRRWSRCRSMRSDTAACSAAYLCWARW